MNIKIEDVVEMPDSRLNSKYPFSDLEVEQSFQVDGDDGAANALRSSASYYGKRNGKLYSVIRNDAGARCWRF